MPNVVCTEHVTMTALQQAVESLFDERNGTGLTLAVVVMVEGEIVAEKYGPTAGPDVTLISWSMAKSITHALVGLLVGDGLLDVSRPVSVPEWQGDLRREITLQHLLNMSSGLRFLEDYVDAGVSNCIEMLFGSGSDDVAGYAASLPLDHVPNSVFNYSSGTTNIICRLASDVLGGGEPELREYLAHRLFGPLGMVRAEPRFDAAGTFIGSSFVYATAREFARFGELYRNDGCVGGERLLPLGWVEHARTPAPAPIPSGERGYGAHWWLWPERSAFAAQGYEGQRIVVVPGASATIVRLGKTAAADGPALDTALTHLIDLVSSG